MYLISVFKGNIKQVLKGNNMLRSIFNFVVIFHKSLQLKFILYYLASKIYFLILIFRNEN